MKIAHNFYQISGHPYGFNSNMFAVNTEKGIIVIDSGFSLRQYKESNLILKKWGLEPDKVIALFVTHAHFDHIGNAHRYRKRGVPVYVGELDADAVENGGHVILEPLFGKKYYVCRDVRWIKDKDYFSFGNVKVKVLGTPGHTKGNVSYLVSNEEEKFLFVGDLFAIGGTTPRDELVVELGWNGSPDFDKKSNVQSLDKMRNLNVDIVAPGHKSVYYGDSVNLFNVVYKMAVEV